MLLLAILILALAAAEPALPIRGNPRNSWGLKVDDAVPWKSGELEIGFGNMMRNDEIAVDSIIKLGKEVRQYNSFISRRKHPNCKPSTSAQGSFRKEKTTQGSFRKEKTTQASLELMKNMKPKLLKPSSFDDQVSDQHKKKNKICNHNHLDVKQRLNNVSEMKQGQFGGENSFKSTEVVSRVPVMKKLKTTVKKDNEHVRLSIPTDGKIKPDSEIDRKHIKIDRHNKVIKNYGGKKEKAHSHQPKINRKTLKKNEKIRLRRSVTNSNLDSESKFITELPILKRDKRFKIENNRPVFIPVKTIGRILTEKYCTSTMENLQVYADLSKDVVNFSDNFSPSPEKLVNNFYGIPCLQQPKREIQELKYLYNIDEMYNLSDSIKDQKNIDEINFDYAKQKGVDDRITSDQISKKNCIFKNVFETLHSYMKTFCNTLRL